jgi:outer membrane protein
MKRLRQFMAIGLCILCTGPLGAQDIAPLTPAGGFVFKSYRPAPIPASRLANSSRLASLVSGNRLYLTAQDAIALALENNIDVESNRYNALIAISNLRRQQAGGPLAGVPTGASNVGVVASGQGVSGSESAAGVSSSGGSSSGSGTVNATISQIGSATPTLDPVFTDTQSYSHVSNPQPQQTLSQTINLIQNTRYYSEGLQQGLITGGQVSLTYSDIYLNENSPTDVLNPSSSNSLGISFQHNLLQGFGRALNARNITIAKANLTINDLNFKQEVTGVVVSVLNGYYGLAADYEDLKAKQSALTVAQRFYEDNKKQVQIGTLAPLDVTSAEAQMASSEQALVVSETTLEQDQLTLKNLLSRNGLADPILSRVDIIPLDHIAVPEKDDLPPIKDLVTSALLNRPELAADKMNLANSVTSALNTNNAVLPTLVVFGSASNSGLAGVGHDVPLTGLGFTGISTSGSSLPAGFAPCPAGVGPKGGICEVPDGSFVGGIGTALGQVAGRHFPNESGGFFFGAPIRDRAALADAAIDQLGLRQTELQNRRSVNQVMVDVSNGYIALQQARIRYKAAVQNRILDEQLLTAEQKKYSLGASTTYTVVQQERDLAVAQSTEVAALVTYSQTQVALDQTTGATLKANNVSIEEAAAGKVSRLSALPQTLPQ